MDKCEDAGNIMLRDRLKMVIDKCKALIYKEIWNCSDFGLKLC